MSQLSAVSDQPSVVSNQSSAVGRPPSDRVIAACLALLLFGIYLLSFSGRIYSSDGIQMLAVTDSLVKRAQVNTDQMWRFFRVKGDLGIDGESYAKYGYGTSLLAAPLYAVALALPEVGLEQLALLASPIAIALAAALLYLTTRRLNFSRRVSLVTALLFALATPAWVYAKEFWSEPFALVTMLASFYFLMRYRSDGNARDALIAGLIFALAVAVRVTNLALAPFFAWYGFVEAWRDARARRALLFFSAPIVLGAVSVAAYNWGRFGNVFETGYRADEQFNNPLLLGAYGLLFSPGKGLLVYAPLLAALVWSAAQMFRRARREVMLIGSIFAIHLVVFSTWHYWSGGTDWGPRYLTPTLPFLMLLLAPAIELALPGELPALGWSWARRAYAILFGLLCAWSVVVELLGISISSLTYHLRVANAFGLPEASEIFDPAYSPLVGYSALLRPRSLHFAWLRANANDANIDWLVIGLTLAFIALSIGLLWYAWRGRKLSRALIGGVFLLAAALALFSVYRYREDDRFGGGAGFRELLQKVRSDSTPAEVMILNDDAVAPFFINENRAPLLWYGLSRSPDAWDDETHALLTRLAQRFHSIWFAYDDAVQDAPDLTQEWLDKNLHQVQQWDFDDGVHLRLYTAEAPQ